MGKAARVKSQRRNAPKAPPPVGGRGQAIPQRLIWIATAGVVALIAVVVGVLLATSSSPKPPPAASASAADRTAPAALRKAADQVGFSPQTEAGVGEIEGKPASAAVPSSNTSLLPVGSTAPGFTLKTPQGASVGLSQFRGKTVLLEFFATWCPHCDAEAPHLKRILASLPVGSTAPGFTLKTPQGASVSLSQLRGKAVLLEFFATWCPHCDAEAPHLKRILAALPASRYEWLGVNADGEDAASVFAYHSYFGLTSPVLLDPSSQPGSFTSPGAAGPVTTKYQVQSFPTFYVLNSKGAITWRSDGEQPDALLRQQLRAAAGA